jgi:hypothetical protein
MNPKPEIRSPRFDPDDASDYFYEYYRDLDAENEEE